MRQLSGLIPEANLAALSVSDIVTVSDKGAWGKRFHISITAVELRQARLKAEAQTHMKEMAPAPLD